MRIKSVPAKLLCLQINMFISFHYISRLSNFPVQTGLCRNCRNLYLLNKSTAQHWFYTQEDKPNFSLLHCVACFLQQVSDANGTNQGTWLCASSAVTQESPLSAQCRANYSVQPIIVLAINYWPRTRSLERDPTYVNKRYQICWEPCCLENVQESAVTRRFPNCLVHAAPYKTSENFYGGRGQSALG